MCGRFAFYSPHEAVVRLFGLPDDIPALEPRYNIAPTMFVPAVRETGDAVEIAESVEDIRAVNVIEMLLETLDPEQQVVVRKLLAEDVQ